MKKLFLNLAIALGLTTMTPAFANYFCPPPCDPCGPTCGPCGPVIDGGCCGPEWSGLYVGGNIGVYTSTIHLNDFDAFLLGGSRSLVNTNFTAGVQVGYDWECSNKLIGIVADWNWVNIRHRSNAASVTTDFTRHDNNWFTTIRARAGVTLCDALFYVSLGGAVHNVKAHFMGTGATVTPGTTITINKTIWGWAGGAGVEYLLGCGWSAGIDFLALNFSHRHGSILADGTTFRLGVASTAFVGRFLLNYRFGDLFGF